MKPPRNIQVSFLIPARSASSFLEHTVSTVHHYLKQQFDDSFEIVIIPNCSSESLTFIETLNISQHLKNKYSNIVIAVHDHHKPGKGAALKTGFNASHGEWIFFTDADLPYNLDFFTQAAMKLNSGIDFVTGNRRSPESYFHFPVSIMPFVYSRHMCGIYFNKVVRHLFGINSRDTQAGIKAMNRNFARTCYALQTCPGFLFDIEFFMVAQSNGLKHAEIPVHLKLNHQVTTIKIFKELVTSFYWLSKIFINKWGGHYKKVNARGYHEDDYSQECHIAADDWGLSPAINRGILKLAQSGIVKRVSVMPECPFANYLLDDLKKIKDLEIGLHLNFTYKKKVDSPIKFLLFTLNPFIKLGFKKSYIQEQIDSQITAMQDLNLHPVHIDGHHHCHIFPYVAPLVASTAEKLNIKQTRLPTESSLWVSKKFLLPLLSLFAKKTFEKYQLNYRPFFYPSLELLQDDAKLKKALKLKSGFEVIVHPADEADLHLNDCADHYNHERVIEYKSLSNL